DVIGASNAPDDNPPPRKPPKPKARRWRRVPSDWAPNDDHRILAESLTVELDAELAKFRDHEFRDPKSDADAAFRTWLRNAAQYSRANRGSRAQPDHVEALFERARRKR